MKTVAASILIAYSLQVVAANTQTPKTLIMCNLGAKQKSEASVIADRPISDSKRILIKFGQKSNVKPIFGMQDDASRGAALSLKCVGSAEKVLLVAGEFFGAGYRKGIALRFHAGRLERIDFAERAQPKWVDLTESDTRLIFSDHGPESQAPLVSYRFVTGQGQVQGTEEMMQLQPLESGTRIEVRP